MARFYWLARDGRGVMFFFCLDAIWDIPVASWCLRSFAGFAGREDVCLGLVQLRLRWRSWRVVIGGWVGMVS